MLYLVRVRIHCHGQEQNWSLFKKKGDQTNVKNYRGISITNCMAKLYDMVLCSRLKQWFRPFREQAGAQEKRGCIEHIVSLRLLCDMARRRKMKLFVTFVDFSQAYDTVPGVTLFRILRTLGCGSVMLCALIAMYNISREFDWYCYNYYNPGCTTGITHVMLTVYNICG